MESSLTSRQWEFEPPSIYSMVSKARLASQERDRIKMPWAHKTFARTDAPREATCSTSEPISQLDERSALGSKVAIACCTSRTRRAIEKLEGPVSPLQWHRNGVCRTRTLHQLRSFRAHGVPKGISNFVTGATMD